MGQKLGVKTLKKEDNRNGTRTTFGSKDWYAELEQAKRELTVCGLCPNQLTEDELLLAIHKKQEVDAATIVPIVLDWFIDKTAIISATHAINYLDAQKSPERPLTYRVIDEQGFDALGTNYLIIASDAERQVDGIFKVYTNGKIVEMWMECA